MKNNMKLVARRKTDLFPPKGLPDKAPEDVHERLAKGQALIEAIPDLIFILSPEGVFLDYHTPDPALLQVPANEFFGRQVRHFFPQDICDKFDYAMRQVLETKRLQFFEYSLTISGKPRHYEARVVGFGQKNFLVMIRDNTDRKELEASLKENQEKYRQLANYAPTGLYEVDYWQQKLVNVNDVICDYLGYTREELLSHNFLTFLPEESRRIFLDRLQKITSHQPVSNVVEFKMTTKEGREIWLLINTRPIHQEGRLKGAFVVAQDITLRKMAEEALRESEGHLRSLMENAKDFAIFRLINRDKTMKGTAVVFVSPSLEAILGPTDRLRFESWFDNTDPEDQERIKKARIASLTTLLFDEEIRIYHPQKKEWRWIRATSNGIVDPDGVTIYINGIIRDITNKKMAEEFLQKAHDQLEDLVEQRTNQLIKINDKLTKEIKERKHIETALAKSEKKLRLLSNKLINAQEDERKRIAIELHDELGQSLVGLKFHLSRLSTKGLGQNKGKTEEITQALQQIDQMTENVRRLSRELRPAVLEHLALFESLHWLFEESSRKYSFKLFNQFPSSLPEFSKKQEIIIFRIFQEALTNIGKHAQAGTVSVQMTEDDRKIVFSIRDDGLGFNPRELSKGQCPEAGLGLTAMAERARMAGGSLRLRSQKGKGTRITFTIPK
jgi:PAS domain S-box-containing protein